MDTYLNLNNGTKMSVLGLGTWQGPEINDYDVTKKAFMTAIDLGYRHLDTAYSYQTEGPVGAAVSQKIKEGVITREDVYITTKLWHDSHRQEKVVPALKESLANLNLDYVDMYLIHWPVSLHPDDGLVGLDAFTYFEREDPEADLNKTWKGMEECVRLGLTKSIGVSNFNMKQLQEIVDNCKIKPASNQIECHVYLQNRKLIDFCRKLDIAVVAYSPLGSLGLLGHTQNMSSLLSLEIGNILTDPILTSLAEKYKKSITQVALKFLVQQGLAIIPKSNNPERQASNIQIFDFMLSDEDMNQLKTLDRNMRVLSAESHKGASQYPFVEYN